MNILKKIILEAVANQAAVAQVEVISKHFRIIELEAEIFKKMQWQPGAKIEIVLHGDKRTYTPVSIDSVAGRMQLLIYIHGNGFGANWAADAKPSDLCSFIGPRSSLDFSNIHESAVLFGDETSFAVASTLKGKLSNQGRVGFVFEVASETEARAALQRLNIENAILFEKASDASHVKACASAIAKLVSDLNAHHLILTGCAPSIQSVRAFLKNQPLAPTKNMTKAYWAPGKSGLD